MLGATFGSYRIDGLIGEGGMGAVYAAEHVLLGRAAAVKVLLPEHSTNQVCVVRFFNEARAATSIRHPGIVEIYDFGYAPDGSAYIAMERLEGESLAARIRRGLVEAGTAVAIVRQVAGALAAAHDKGIVHRDLKPDNVFLVADPEVPGGERIKLLDFGIAKLVQDVKGHAKTQTGAVIGTPTYMAPEQCRGVSVDARADLYSLGCLLFEMVSGRPPFVGEGVGDVLTAHIHVPPPSLRAVAPSAPAPLEALVAVLLRKQPSQRPQTAQAVIAMIDALSLPGLPGLTGLSRGPAGRSRPATVEPRPMAVARAAPLAETTLSIAVSDADVRSRRTGIWIGLGIGAAALAGVLIAVVLDGGSGEVSADGKRRAAARGSAPLAPERAGPVVEPIRDVLPLVEPALADPSPAAAPIPAAPTPAEPTLTNPPLRSQRMRAKPKKRVVRAASPNKSVNPFGD